MLETSSSNNFSKCFVKLMIDSQFSKPNLVLAFQRLLKDIKRKSVKAKICFKTLREIELDLRLRRENLRKSAKALSKKEKSTKSQQRCKLKNFRD